MSRSVWGIGETYNGEDIRCLVGDIEDLLSRVIGTLSITRDNIFRDALEFFDSEANHGFLFVEIFLIMHIEHTYNGAIKRNVVYLH